MAIAKEDIIPGWYWVREHKTGELSRVEVWLLSGGLWIEGPEGGNEVDDALKWFDFIARIEPPEGV